MVHLGHGQLPAGDGDGASLAAAELAGVGHGVAVAPATPPGAAELLGAALAAGAQDEAGA
jgi:hypothetical protein